MIDVDLLYFKWLVKRVGGHTKGFERLCWMMHRNAFGRRVGNDENRAIDGAELRRVFLNDYTEMDFEPHVSNDLLERDCSWFEMLVALSEAIDFIYDGGVYDRFMELIGNLGLTKVIFSTINAFGESKYDELDQEIVDAATSRVDANRFDESGNGGLFPLTNPRHYDQREVEIWAQHAAYFRERLEGVMWTSTS